MADQGAAGAVLRRADLRRGRLRRVGIVWTDRGPQCGARLTRRGAARAAADDGDWRAGLLRGARRSEALRTDEHHVRHHAASRQRHQESGSQAGHLRARLEGARRMEQHLRNFLDYIALNRNASAHTVAAYESDLSQFLAFAARNLDIEPGNLEPGNLQLSTVRAFMADLYKQGQARASV